MQLDWLLNPITFYSVATACLLVSTALFISIKLQMAKARKQAAARDSLRESETAAAVRELETGLAGLRNSISQLEAIPPARPVAAGINLTKRAQALRMHRRGESLASIAAALQTPGNEIALLLKVHGLTSESAN